MNPCLPACRPAAHTGERLDVILKTMKRLLLVFICNSIIGYSLFSQNTFLNGIYISPVEGLESTVYEFKNDTFIHTSGDVFECGVRGTTQKGIYSIQGNKIYFKPLSPETFQKSIVKYSKEQFRSDRYDIGVQIYTSKYDTNFYFEVFIYDTTNSVFPFITLFASNKWITFSYGGKQRISKIEIISGCYEKVELEFDPDFYGKHNYEINLAEKLHNYVYREPYIWDLIEIKPKFIIVRQSYSSYKTLMVKSEYVTDEFISTGVFTEKNE